MKTIKYISVLALTLFTATSCMNVFDEPEFNVFPFGNNEIGEANTTIDELKTIFASTISASGVKEVTDSIIIEGVVVADDAQGNVYKQLIINDTTGAIIIGVNDVGLYSMTPVGQRIRIDCRGLHVGGYGKMAQVGGLYNGGIGRMNQYLFPQHVRLIGAPDRTQREMTPEVIDESFFTNENKDKLAKYVRLENVEITEADGTALWAPAELDPTESGIVERHIKMGNTNLVLRMSTYADFANEIIPDGKLNINGVLTRFKDYWQFVINATSDIEQIQE